MGVSVSKGTWTARHGKDKATYAETRFGAAAQQLAERAYLQMVAGSFDKARDDIELRQSYSMKETALLLGMTEGNWTARPWCHPAKTPRGAIRTGSAGAR